jgi:hypothetical protein
MEGLILVLVVLGLIVFDILALRFGVDSRPVEDSRRNWY